MLYGYRIRIARLDFPLKTRNDLVRTRAPIDIALKVEAPYKEKKLKGGTRIASCEQELQIYFTPPYKYKI